MVTIDFTYSEDDQCIYIEESEWNTLCDKIDDFTWGKALNVVSDIIRQIDSDIIIRYGWIDDYSWTIVYFEYDIY